MARHRGTCGVEVMRKRKRCQYCGKDLTEGYIKKHATVCKKKQAETVVDRQAPQGAEMVKIQDLIMMMMMMIMMMMMMMMMMIMMIIMTIMMVMIVRMMTMVMMSIIKIVMIARSIAS